MCLFVYTMILLISFAILLKLRKIYLPIYRNARLRLSNLDQYELDKNKLLQRLSIGYKVTIIISLISIVVLLNRNYIEGVSANQFLVFLIMQILSFTPLFFCSVLLLNFLPSLFFKKKMEPLTPGLFFDKL